MTLRFLCGCGYATTLKLIQPERCPTCCRELYPENRYPRLICNSCNKKFQPYDYDYKRINYIFFWEEIRKI